MVSVIAVELSSKRVLPTWQSSKSSYAATLSHRCRYHHPPSAKRFLDHRHTSALFFLSRPTALFGLLSIVFHAPPLTLSLSVVAHTRYLGPPFSVTRTKLDPESYSCHRTFIDVFFLSSRHPQELYPRICNNEHGIQIFPRFRERSCEIHDPRDSLGSNLTGNRRGDRREIEV